MTKTRVILSAKQEEEGGRNGASEHGGLDGRSAALFVRHYGLRQDIQAQRTLEEAQISARTCD